MRRGHTNSSLHVIHKVMCGASHNNGVDLALFVNTVEDNALGVANLFHVHLVAKPCLLRQGGSLQIEKDKRMYVASHPSQEAKKRKKNGITSHRIFRRGAKAHTIRTMATALVALHRRLSSNFEGSLTAMMPRNSKKCMAMSVMFPEATTTLTPASKSSSTTCTQYQKAPSCESHNEEVPIQHRVSTHCGC